MKAKTLYQQETAAYIRRIRFKFKLQDMWIGIFWKKTYDGGYESCTGDWELVTFDLYICLLPCLVIHYDWLHKHKEAPTC